MKQLTDVLNKDFVRAIEDIGGEVFLVGGCVRDMILGKDPKDIDLIVRNIGAKQLEKLLETFGSVDLVGESFGVFKFKHEGEEYDIALPRSDSKIAGAKGHKSIETQSDPFMPLEQDLMRRDFTINAMAIDKEGKLIDPFQGLGDLNSGIIHCVTPETFVDDPLRLMRAVQFAARFNFNLSQETFELIKANKHLINEEPAERLLTEFQKVFDKNGNPAFFAHLLDVTGLFEEYFGHSIKKRRLDNTCHLSEFLFFGIADENLRNIADFYNKKFGSAMSGELHKQLKAFDIVYNHPAQIFWEDKGPKITIFHTIFNACKQSEIVLTSNHVKSEWSEPFINGEFPRNRSEMALTGDDLIEMGWKQGKELGLMIEKMLDGIFTRKLKNNRESLLNFVNQTQQ